MSEQSYIIRIYRSSKNNSGQADIDGIVETPETGKREAFHNVDDLWRLLAGRRRVGKRRKLTVKP